MVKTAVYKRDDGALLVIWRTPTSKLVGEFYANGVYRRGRWDGRATFDGGDAVDYRVREYFGFSTSNSIAYWKRWA